MPLPRCTGRINMYGQMSHYNSAKAVVASARNSSTVCSEGTSRKKNDYYTVLSLEHSAAVGAEDIKRAYRRLALRYHPDVCPPSRRAEWTERFLELRRAYETLSDPAQRVRYDAEARRAASGDDEGHEAAWTSGVVGGFVARDVWEAQLGALRARSEQRQRARRSGGVRSAVAWSD
ncbi:hypothetical protein HU200_042165 [Digitaria exilis]|uniref:J domain-containing protein n=1 Tax=Digitaria exilis TaxID=1010633 RepID=A0A835BBC8_9POAL|nr:hypothetical protein HU200_042165 [Digitaria exilis]